MARNRRIGVGLVDFTGWKHDYGVHKIIKYMRTGYKVVRKCADAFNEQAGVPHPIRYTTVKPGGTGPKLPGRTSGLGHPTFDYTLRRVRVAKNSVIHPLLTEAGVPYEGDVFDKYTDCFEWPILQGPARSADRVSLWEQAMNLITVQREWSDNAVSNTLYFKPKWVLTAMIEDNFEKELAKHIGWLTASNLLLSKVHLFIVKERYKITVDLLQDAITQIKVYEYDPTHEEDDVEPVLSMIAPLTKSVSMLPHSPKGAYRQMPEEHLSRQEYESRLAEMRTIDWSQLQGSDGQDTRYCEGEICEVPQ